MDLTRDQVHKFHVRDYSDVGACRRKAVHFAKQLGFDEVKLGEVAILTSEMISNIVLHSDASGYFFICRVQSEPELQGIEMWSCDYGKGIPDVDQAVKDGVSENPSLGIGLGSIKRLSDEFAINPDTYPSFIGSDNPGQDQVGTLIYSRKWLSKIRWVGTNKNLELGAASRPFPGEQYNGDEYAVVHLSPEETLIAVIDGLGHGEDAHKASLLAKERILGHPYLALEDLMQQVHISLRGTRGATIGLARIDTQSEKVSFLGVGNIEGRIFGEDSTQSLISLGGIVGHKMRTPQLLECEFTSDNVLVLHSDGLKSGWQNTTIACQQNLQKIAEELLSSYARNSDDATILIVRNAPRNR